MRIDQIDVDIAGWPTMSGTMRLPEQGVGVWATGNGHGKSTLVALVATALYGVSEESSEVPPSGWLMVSMTLDSGERLVVARDLGTGALQVTDSAGEDVTDRWSDAPSLGEALLGFTCSQFLAATHVTLDSARTTIGDPVLRSMLAYGRGPQAAPSAQAPHGADGTPAPHDGDGTQPPRAPDDAPPVPDPPAASTEAGDLPIFHSAAEEMEWVASSSFASGDRVLSLDGETEPAVEDPAPTPPEEAAPNAATSPANRELRELKQSLDEANATLEASEAEFRVIRGRLSELGTERDRLGSLDGAEPSDVQRLEELIGAMKKVADRKEQVRVQEKRFRDELEQRSISADELAPLDELFARLEEDDREFLDAHQQLETVRRGNQALTRSEARLDESRLQEIQRSRDDATRLALTPLIVAALGLFGSLAAHTFPSIPVPPSTLIAAGLAGAVASAALLLRAKRLRASERREIAETLQRKHDQLEQFDHEGEEAAARIDELAAAHADTDGPSFLKQHARWQAHLAELAELASFDKRMAEIESEAVTLREQLASFAVSAVGDPSDMTDTQLDAMVNDYIRHFTVGTELEAAEARAAELETELASSEGEVAELSARISAILEAEDIDSARDLDEAIEIHALRTRGGDPAPSAEPETANDGGWHEIDPDAGSDPPPAPGAPFETTSEAEWSPAISARAEAIVRRFLPDAREFQVDGELVPRLRIFPDGPFVAGPELPGLGAASRDQVCLALRLAIVETLSTAGEQVPIFLDEPFARADDARHGAAIRFLVEDASQRGQVVYLTSHEVRFRWFQHQHPELRERLVAVREAPAADVAPAPSPAAPAPSPAAPASSPAAPAPSPAASESSSPPAS